MKSRNLFNLTIVLIILSFLALACTISPWQQPATNTQIPPAATQTATPDEETAKLQKRLEDLEKELEKQKKQPVQPQAKKNVPIIQGSGSFARVSSPGDGFLALRSEPNSETGYRILQIPHGATVKILGCQNYVERVGGRVGRWCRVSYDGYTGWAFDGWLVY